MKTRLSDRTLWFDGTNEVLPGEIAELLLNGVHPSKIATSTDPEIDKFNQFADETEAISIGKVKNNKFDYSWDIPEEYVDLDIKPIIALKLISYLDKQYPGRADLDLDRKYVDRLNLELSLIEKYKLEPIFRTILFIVDTLERTNTVWGVGRGSSCASLALFLTGIHLVDPVKYDIPPEEFFHS